MNNTEKKNMMLNMCNILFKKKISDSFCLFSTLKKKKKKSKNQVNPNLDSCV